MKQTYSYQDLLSRNKERFTVLGIFELEKETREMPKPVGGFYNARIIGGSLEELRDSYPELKIKNLPAFYIFENARILYVAKDLEELNTYLTQDKVLIYEGKSENWRGQLIVYQKLGSGKMDFFLGYIGKDKHPSGTLEFELTGSNFSWQEGSLVLDPLGNYTTDNPIEVQMTENDSIICTIKQDGKKEQIILKFKEDAS
ncbi:hypothetical protein D1B31_05025 [Neobacillus notoginsengisoli]|uniref:Uncharacterized protein n=1 Tax=Neobacillus notoginsengisoli TaxID=1578198 RepID=A0A417YWV4_9BACI|nr:hypothetical protein [Neobacillus notoginsengisoli]RHW42009.1 hypothetical protein D1B31_05025 [Neobacillus notoginsengisoli]